MFTFPICHFTKNDIKPSLTFTQYSSLSSATASPIFTNVSFGSNPSPTRRIVCVIIGFAPPNALSSVTIGGVSATIHTSYRHPYGTLMCIASANVPNGTSGTVIANYTSNTNSSMCFTYAIDGMQSYIPTSYVVTSSAYSQSVTCDENSGIIAGGACYINGGTANSWLGTLGIVEDSDNSIGGGYAGVGTSASLLTSAALSSKTVILAPGTTNGAQMQIVIFK